MKNSELNIGGIKKKVSIVSMVNRGYEGNNKIDRIIIDEINWGNKRTWNNRTYYSIAHQFIEKQPSLKQGTTTVTIAETIIILNTCNATFVCKHNCGVRKINYVLPRDFLCAAKINHNSVTGETE